MSELAEKQKERIIRVLKKSDLDLTQVEIARRSGMNRTTAAKYLRELIGEGKIAERTIGKYTLYRVKK